MVSANLQYFSDTRVSISDTNDVEELRGAFLCQNILLPSTLLKPKASLMSRKQTVHPSGCPVQGKHEVIRRQPEAVLTVLILKSVRSILHTKYVARRGSCI
jgi:hypothetical protein